MMPMIDGREILDPQHFEFGVHPASQKSRQQDATAKANWIN
jgi:hypothetical protein